MKYFPLFSVSDNVDYCKVIIIFCLLLYVSGTVYPLDDLYLQFDENYFSTGLSEGRILAGFQRYRISCLDFRGGEDEKTVFSFYSPFFIAGRVKTEGLIKEMENPSYWLPGSDIYYDDPDITDDISLDFNGKNAIVIKPFSGIAFFTMAENDDYSDFNRRGGYAVFKFSEKTRLNASVIASRGEKKGGDSDWYFERDGEFGSDIYNTAAGLIREGDFLSVSFSMGTSSGEYFRHGSFFRLSPAVIYEPLSLYFLVSMTDKEYRKPGGGYPSVRERRGVKGELRVNETTDTEAGYYIDMYHTKYTEEIISRMGEKIFGGINYDSGLIFINFDGYRKNSFDEEYLETVDSLSLKSGFKTTDYYISFEGRNKYTDGLLSSVTFAAETSVRKGNWEILLKRRKVEEKKTSATTTGRITFSDSRIKVYGEGKYETEDLGPVNLKSVFLFATGIRIRY